MGKNNHVMLLVSIFWMVATVLTGDIFQRAVNMSLAVSCLSIYIGNHFLLTSMQKIWLKRINIFALAAAAVFLVLEIYNLFIA